MSGVTSQTPATPRFLFPPWLSGPWGMVGRIAIIYTLINIAWTHFHWGGSERITLIANLFSFFPSMAAAAVAWRVAAEKEIPAPQRRAWLIMGVSFLMVLIGDVVWAFLEVVLGIEPFPSIADVFYLAFYLIGLWGLLSMPSMPQNRRERLTLWLDLLCILTAAAMFVVYFIIVPTAAVSGNDLLTQLIAPAYPIGSLLLIGGILAVLYRPASPNTQSALSLLLIGMIFFVSADFVFGYTSLIGTYTVGGWTDASWNVAQLFFALAGLRKLYLRRASAAPPGQLAGLHKPGRWLPPVAVALGYGLLFYVVTVDFTPAAAWLMAGALGLTLLVITRQIVSPAFADLPVRAKVILSFIMVSVLSVSLVSATAYLTVRSNLQSVVEINLAAHARDQARAIVSLLSKQSDALEGFVLNKALQDEAAAASDSYATEDLALIREQLRQREAAWSAAADSAALVQDRLNNAAAEELHEFQDNFPGFNDLVLADKYGALLAATTRPANYDQSILGWWEAAFYEGQGAIYISQPILEAGAESPHIIIVVPIHAHLNAELAGMLIATYSLKDMAQLLATESAGDREEDGLLLPTGQMLTSDGQFVLVERNTLERLPAAADGGSVLMIFEGKPQLVSQAAVTAFDFDPEEALAFEGLDWKLIAHQDPAAAFRPLNAAWRTTLLTTLVVLLLTTGLAVLLAQGLVAPISRLTAVARQIEAGDISTKAPVESRDEIGTLAVTFNTMLDALARTQQELQESESLYRSLVEYSPDMIVVHGGGRILFINPAGVTLLGAPGAQELVGQPLMELIHPEDQKMAAEELDHLMILTAPSPLLQRKMHRLDGTTFDAEFRAIPISYAGQPATQFVMRDITERKEAEDKIHQLLIEVGRQRGDLERRVAQRTEELNQLNLRLQDELEERQRLVQSLQESEERFRLVFDTSPDAIFLLDPHDSAVIWRIVDCNPSACQMNGYTREELIGESIDMLNAEKGGLQGFVSTFERLRRETMIRGIEATHRHKDGHVFPIEYSTALITLNDREFVLGIDRDITERKQVEQALKQTKELAEEANRAKSEFLSRMSHELRTPMNAILGFAQLLAMSQKDPLTSTQRERVRQIVKGGQHLLDLINEILDISRIEAGRLQLSPEPVPIRESIQDAIDLTASLANNRNIQIQFSLAAEANPYVMADRQRLKQVLLNLLSNAVKYNAQGGFVAVTCEAARSDRDAWRISVTDTGLGIPPEALPHLFTPFERLSADRTNVEGTGLGLALARRLVELMKGQIGVESAVGQGSTFWIELPSAESQLERLQRAGGTGPLPVMSDTARTILYIEDNIANFELIRQVLADYARVKLLWGTDSETGFELAHEHHPDLILLDLHLGGIDGGEVLQRLKADGQTAGIPVVMVSADATPGQIERLLALGAQSYLTKPLDIKLFIQLIEKVLGEKGG